MRRPLDDDAAAVLDDLGDDRQPPTRTLAPPAAREHLSSMLDSVPSPPIPDVREVTIDPGPVSRRRSCGLTVRLYYPTKTGSSPCVAYFHGGGWIEGDLDTHDVLCRRLATESGCVVAAVDYRRAPEHPFPAGLWDCYDTVQWLARHGSHVDIEPASLAVAGDSAGGALAAGVSLLAAQHDGPAIEHQVLLDPMCRSPVQDEFDSLRENATGGFLETATVEHFQEQYCSDRTDHWNSTAFPLLADDCTRFPSTTLLTAGHDPLRDEGTAFADALDDAGVAVDRRHDADQPHVSVLFAHRIPAAQATIEWVGDSLASALDD